MSTLTESPWLCMQWLAEQCKTPLLAEDVREVFFEGFKPLRFAVCRSTNYRDSWQVIEFTSGCNVTDNGWDTPEEAFEAAKARLEKHGLADIERRVSQAIEKYGLVHEVSK